MVLAEVRSIGNTSVWEVFQAVTSSLLSTPLYPPELSEAPVLLDQYTASPRHALALGLTLRASERL